MAQPPFEISSFILKKIASIAEKLGEVNSAHLHKPPPELRKRNRIRTIGATLAIEGNTLTEEQITALLENKRVVGPQKDIQEVLNAIKVYEELKRLDPLKIRSFLKAHAMLMTSLIPTAGKLRTEAVGIVRGSEVAHLAPPAWNVQHLMTELFGYLKKTGDHVLIKSCVFHYEMEFIHPFMDGNGRMGRLWQTLILMNEYPVFEFLPLETIVKKKQELYYGALAESDRAGSSTRFIEFMLEVVEEALADLLSMQSRVMKSVDRVEYFKSVVGENGFSRQDYLRHFRQISPVTASRDLAEAVASGILERLGDKRTATYKYHHPS
ncbi:MAG: Fic family protein [Bacteroidetes bacterium]|nr:Fic family protein [Bacteroidota bacterium]